MAVLIAGGDSFTYGSELADSYVLADPTLGQTEPYEQASQHSYAALLAKSLGLDYVCAAEPGLSNSAIRRTTMNACAVNDVGFVIVMWSFLSRYEIRYDGAWQQLSIWSIADKFDRITEDFHIDNPIVLDHHITRMEREQRAGIPEFARMYYKHVAETYWEVYTSLTEIVMLQQYLQLNKIPYLFTSVDHGLDNVNKFKDSTLTTLMQQIDTKRWMYFPVGIGFYEWAKEQKFPMATTHPTELAHIAAEKRIYEYIRNISGIS